MKILKNIFALFIIAYIIRLFASMSMGLMPQDAYYYFYSDNLDWSYFDHPPMVAYMLKLFSFILGKSVISVKLSNFLTTLASVYAFYVLAKKFIHKERAKFATILYGSTLLITVLSINTTPDVPLILFWTLALISFHNAIYKSKVLHWVLTGLFIGLAFDSKYTALIMIPGVFMFLILAKNQRHILLSYKPYLMLAVFIATIYPVYYWNVQHDWISFTFQSTRRTASISEFEINPRNFFGNIGTQIGLLLPVLFTVLFKVYYKYLKRSILKWKLPSEQRLFLASFSLPIIAFFFFISIFYWVKLNWIMPGYIAAIILIAPYVSHKLARYQLYTSIVLGLILFVEVTFYVFPVKSDDTWYGWEELNSKVENLQLQNPKAFVFANDGYKTSAVLNFYNSKHIYSSNIIAEHGLQFNIVDHDLSALKGKDAIYIDSDKRLRNLEKLNKTREDLNPYFEKVEELDPILIKDAKGKVQRKFWVYKCSNYKGT